MDPTLAADPTLALGGEPPSLAPELATGQRVTDVAPSDIVPEQRPPVPQRITAATAHWWARTDDLPQRENALFEFREANKTLFPSRFNGQDGRRGQSTNETRRKKDNRRVQTPYIYRDTLQATALTVPDDTDFDWSSRPQVEPIQTPQVDLVTGQTSVPAPTMASLDPLRGKFAETMKITQRHLLDEVGFVQVAQAWVQDSGTYPLAIIKYAFRRDYDTAHLNPNSGNRDAEEMIARFRALMQRYTAKQFDHSAPDYEEMLELMRSLAKQSAITRWYGIDLQLVPMSAFGVSEDALDKVSIYSASFMFHDAVMTGDELLAAYPYREATAEDTAGIEGEESDYEARTTYGVLPSELTKVTPFLGSDTVTDPLAGSGSTRGRGRSTGRSVNRNSVSASQVSNDPRQQKFLVREVWCKADRRVMTFVKGLDHMVESYVPKVTSEQWYPFAILSPNRVPTEVYGCSDLELKRDIQARIHMKRTDEEKGRELHLPRGIYNTAAGVDQNEMLKLNDIPAGHMRGVNFGSSQQRIDDIVQHWSFDLKPECFFTEKDEQDMSRMGALPSQASGETGVANFASEVQVASAGMSIATKYRQGQVRYELERMLTALAEVMVQELTPHEVRQIAGPFAVWPEIHTDAESAAIMAEAKERIATDMAPALLEMVMAEITISGRPLEPLEVQQLIDRSVAPLLAAEMMKRFGSPEPVSRESLFARMQIKVSSTTSADLDRATNLQQLGMLSQAIQGIQTVAMASGLPFDPRPVFKRHSILMGGKDAFDEMFPAVPPMQLEAAKAAQTNAAAQAASPGAPAADAPQGNPKGGPKDQGVHGQEVEPAQQARNGIEGGRPPGQGAKPA